WRISMAESTRVETPSFSSASCSARLLITVASMPMVSALARSMPISLATAPRKILPPPTTSARSQPSSLTSLISWAKALTVAPSMPKLLTPAKTSPVTLRMIRLYFGAPLFMKFAGARVKARRLFFSGRFAQMIAREAPDLNVFAEPADRFVDDIGDLFVRIFDERLLEQARFRVKAVDLALDDLVHDLFRLAALQRLLAVDRFFLVELRRRHFLAPQVARIGRGDLHRDVFEQGLKFRRARNEVGLAVDLHQHADLAARMNVRSHRPVRRHTFGLLCRRRQSFLAQVVDRPGHLPAALGKGLLAVHHSRSGLFPELFYRACADFHGHQAPAAALSAPAASAAARSSSLALTSDCS